MASNIIVEYAHRYRKGVTGKMSKVKWLDWNSKTNASLHFKLIREYDDSGNNLNEVVEPPEANEAIINQLKNKKHTNV